MDQPKFKNVYYKNRKLILVFSLCLHSLVIFAQIYANTIKV